MLNSYRRWTTQSLLICTLLPTLATASDPEGVNHKVGMKEWLFTPTEITIQKGERVTWINDDTTNHNVAFIEIKPNQAPSREKPQKLRKRKSYSLTFDKAGIFNYVCTLHENFDMKGTVTVK